VNGSRDLLLEFWDPCISRERLKLETSNWHANWPQGVVSADASSDNHCGFMGGLAIQGCGLGLDVSVSRRTNVSSRSRLEKSCQRLGLVHLRIVSKTNFRPNCAGHINKTSQFWAPRECFNFTAASAGAFCIHSRSVSKSSVDRYSYYCSL